MKGLIIILAFIVMTFSLQACETTKGFQKDMAYMFSSEAPSEEYKNNWMYKTDAWMRENMW